MYRILAAVDEDAETTSQVEALSEPEEACAQRVVKRSREMRKFHQQLRWRMTNGSGKVVAVGSD